MNNAQIYTGRTDNLKRRYNEHCRGNVQTTSKYLPLELIYYEAFRSKADAIRRETYLKTSTGKRMIKLMLRASLQ